MNLYKGIYHGIVVQNNDPEHLGRVKVWVPGVNYQPEDIENIDDLNFFGGNVGGMTPEEITQMRMHLPWAAVIAPILGMGSSGIFDAAENLGVLNIDDDDCPDDEGPIQPRNNAFLNSREGAFSPQVESLRGTAENGKIKPEATTAQQIYEFEVIRGHRQYFDENGNPKSFPAYITKNGRVVQSSRHNEYAGGLISLHHPEAYNRVTNTPAHRREEEITNYIDSYTSGFYSSRNPAVDLAIRDSIWHQGPGGSSSITRNTLRELGEDVPGGNGWTPALRDAVDNASAKNPERFITEYGRQRDNRIGNIQSLNNRVASATQASLDRLPESSDSLPENPSSPSSALFADVSFDESEIITPPEFDIGDCFLHDDGVATTALVDDEDIFDEEECQQLTQTVHSWDIWAKNIGSVEKLLNYINSDSDARHVNTYPPVRTISHSTHFNGPVSIPAVGAHVWTSFNMGDPLYPMVLGYCLGNSDFKGVHSIKT